MRDRSLCPRHGSPLPDGRFVCVVCSDELRAALMEVAPTVRALPEPVRDEHGQLLPGEAGRLASTPWEAAAGRAGELARDLALTLTRQGVTGVRGGGGRSREQPVPFDERASSRGAALVSALQAAYRELLIDRGQHQAVHLADATALASRLLEWVEELCRLPHAAAHVDAVSAAVRSAKQVVDIRGERWFAGPCRAPLHDEDDHPVLCTVPLYAAAGEPVVRCPRCGAEHDVADRRAWLLEQAQDRLLPAAEMAAVLDTWGQRVTAARIRQWFHRDKLERRGGDRRGRPMFRVGDVVQLLADAATAEQRKRDRTAA